MRTAGLAVDMPSPGRPRTQLVVLDNGSGSPTVVTSETFPSRNTDIATQLHDAAETVRSRLNGLSVARVVVRRADRPPRATNEEGPRIRLLTEGAIASAARSVVVETHIGNGKDTGGWFGSTKAGVDQASTILLQAQGISSTFVEATSAALAAMCL